MTKQMYKYTVVDSCGWLEFFAGDPNRAFFRPAITSTSNLLVPAICLYEVGKRMYQQRGEKDALEALGMMRKAHVIQLNEDELFQAAVIASKYKLAMGDALVWYTAQLYKAQLFTQDKAFKNLPDVAYVEKPAK